MGNIHSHQVWGRTRRPKNILGADLTEVAGNASSDVIDATDPADDLKETISAVSLDKGTRQLSITTVDSIGTDVFDGVTGEVFAQGLHPLLSNVLLRVLSTTDGSNITVVQIPDDINANQLRNMTVTAGGTLVKRTTHGLRTENAMYLHLFMDDTGGNGITLDVWGYNYAFGRWAPLTMPVDLDGTVAAAFKNVQFTVTSIAQMHIVPICGVDRVYFRMSGNQASIKVAAAISTF